MLPPMMLRGGKGFCLSVTNVVKARLSNLRGVSIAAVANKPISTVAQPINEILDKILLHCCGGKQIIPWVIIQSEYI